jgi:mono/diheme cytochrome c family protein
MGKTGALVLAGWLSGVAGQAMAGGGPASDDKAGSLHEGKQLYQQYCASCHGIDGEGQLDWQTPNALGELPAPPHDPTGHTWKHSEAMLYRIIAEGWRDPWNKTDRLTMPAFGEVLSPHQIRLVVDYLKTLWTPEQRQHQQEESQDAPFPLVGD